METNEASSALNSEAIPTLRVMRLQSPDFHVPLSGPLTEACTLQSALCLPDSLGVFVGERFTAYLGILNSSTTMTIRKLSVSVQLQTPSVRWQLPTSLEPQDAAPSVGIDSIVSHDIEEAGQHILRVEVGYLSLEGSSKTFRKFYRFNVASPFSFRTQCCRYGDAKCFVSVVVEYETINSSPSPSDIKDTLVVSSIAFAPADGLVAEIIQTNPNPMLGRMCDKSSLLTAVDLLDNAQVLYPRSSVCYLFVLTAASKDAILRGIASGDVLGRAVVTWCKAMGETGRVTSPVVQCPPISELDIGKVSDSQQLNSFCVYQSGLPVDIAAAAAMAQSRNASTDTNDVYNMLSVSVEPIDPPSKMQLHVPRAVQFLIVNHSTIAMTLQVQFVQSKTRGVVVCGTSFQTLENVPANGGSSVITCNLMPLSCGLLVASGCRVVDLVSGREFLQPPLFHVFVVDRYN